MKTIFFSPITKHEALNSSFMICCSTQSHGLNTAAGIQIGNKIRGKSFLNVYVLSLSLHPAFLRDI
jgi:hypothetical protein